MSQATSPSPTSDATVSGARVGRLAAPVALKILNGRGTGKDGRPRDSGGRAIDRPPPFRRLAPEKPASLSAQASAHWDEIVPEAARLELLTPAHIGGLVLLCETWAISTEALADVRKRGVLIKSKRGMTRNPSLLAFTGAAEQYRALAIQFGLTPAAEGRLKPKEADGGEDNPFE